MTTIRAGDISFKDAQERISRLVRDRRPRILELMRRHGAMIEVKAAAITPVDKGFLRRANKVTVGEEGSAVVLTAENRMVYAVWQHNYPHHHSQPQARDHFIAIPFGAELPGIVDDIIQSDMEAVQ